MSNSNDESLLSETSSVKQILYAAEHQANVHYYVHYMYGGWIWSYHRCTYHTYTEKTSNKMFLPLPSLDAVNG